MSSTTPSLTPQTRSQLLSRLHADQSQRWRQGEEARIEDYLAQYPNLIGDAEGVLDLIGFELLHRLENGDSPSLDEYLRRFPQHADTLRHSWARLRMGRPQGQPQSEGLNSTAVEDTASSSSSPRLVPTFTLPGFELYEKLGEGGMGVVYRARDIRLDQPRAIKVIRAGIFAEEHVRDRFLREAKAVARLDHPGVVRIFSLGEHADILYICMEFLEGGSLRTRLRQGRLDIREAADLVRQLALGTQHAHENKVLHRDLKPANVLLAADGTPKVADFGLAKLLDEDDDLTYTGAVMGTPPYMAPEQAEGRQTTIGERTDIYALGVILYECLAGRPPFRGEGRSETLELVKNQSPAPPRRFRAEVSAELEAICLKCLEKRPEDRYATAGELAADLQDWLDGKPLRIRSRRRRRRWLVALLAFVLLAGLGAGAFLLLPRHQPEDDPPPLRAVADTQPIAEVWQPLLTREPAALRWPDPGKNSHKLFKPGSRELVVSCEELGLLALGETASPRYEFIVTLQQNPWVGNIGLFFGYKEGVDKAGPTQSYHALVIISERQANQGQFMRLEWKTVLHKGGINGVQQHSWTNASSSLFQLAPKEHRLGLKVGSAGLESVTLDGMVLKGLSSATAKNFPSSVGYKGKFGVYVYTGNGAFRDARYFFHEEP
ncbi:MAG TPA: serine/threonine-protein kinase [Gemmataceae bacterium]|nr:serine/threonine-protein kinase [Gemmataceae bacterium]